MKKVKQKIIKKLKKSSFERSPKLKIPSLDQDLVIYNSNESFWRSLQKMNNQAMNLLNLIL